MPESIELTVERPAPNIVDALTEALPTLPIGVIRRAVASGRVTVNGSRVAHDHAPQPGQRVVLTLPDQPIVRFQPQPLDDLEVLYEDAETLAINKPVGLSPMPDPTSREARLINGLLHYAQNDSPLPCSRIYIVHRLDKDTSGALLFAKSPDAARHYSSLFEERQVEKHYLGLVQGELPSDHGEVDAPIAQGTRGRMRLRERRGKRAVSRWSVTERFRGFTLLHLQPLTGRKHQLRLHCSSLRHPLAVDPLYGGRDALFLSEIKRDYRPKADRPEPPLIDRLTLHASRLALTRPDGTPLAIDAPLPDDIDRLLRTLRKYAPPSGG
jgi:23S rRNA pseudouridine955/2504/2580 synthase/23S rRNA pseudouridine1911/1915/1917 synthase